MIDHGDEFEKYDDDVIEYHIKSSPDRTSVTLTVKADTPISQDQYEMILLSFVEDMRLGETSGNTEWVLDDTDMDLQ